MVVIISALERNLDVLFFSPLILQTRKPSVAWHMSYSLLGTVPDLAPLFFIPLAIALQSSFLLSPLRIDSTGKTKICFGRRTTCHQMLRLNLDTVGGEQEGLRYLERQRIPPHTHTQMQNTSKIKKIRDMHSMKWVRRSLPWNWKSKALLGRWIREESKAQYKLQRYLIINWTSLRPRFKNGLVLRGS